MSKKLYACQLSFGKSLWQEFSKYDYYDKY